ncbi:TlpA family protein disulfide reductase [Fluviicola taffensis]|uniref:Alkyl hydroperoxide reductase/ Thiol specific antioxidant/ Mal allergen n=1 Tax=Fluviicola taffensis (strain DSM 16823 / NCIMB 13979 / RW262) TaxID=755732 RepID=F2IHP6_FLUTR|nr:TlpA disulfide reductase family protein [Fluviicola taffensis]AEA44824.1 alkyl hydroperoxide reductase/ Thiol specific antioxidant/ Mal allergen [Fluviicola taffensis DSM 16823]
MIRYPFLIALFSGLFLVSACGDDNINEETGLVNNFHIEGQIKGAANEKLKIQAQSQEGVIDVAETMTDGSGNFELDGNIPGMGIYSLSLGESGKNAVVIPIDINDQIGLQATKDNFAIEPVFSGTQWAKPLTKYMALFSDFAKKQMEIMPTIKDQTKQLAMFAQLKKPIVNFSKTQINKDPKNPVNLILVNLIMPSPESGFADWDPKNLDALRKVETAFQRNYPESPMTGLLAQQVAAIDAQYQSYIQYSSGTVTAPEIALKNPTGSELRLSNLKGKVVLIDFWASWCAPCRKENPNVVRLYKKYRGQGFEIYSVSLDQDPAAWKSAIDKDGLFWSNHVSDLMGWQTPLVQAYGIQGIPHTVLLNREGNIVGVGLRGPALEQKLIEQLAKK